MTDNKKTIKLVYNILVKFLKIQNNKYNVTEFYFRDILSLNGYSFEYNLFPFVYDNLNHFKTFVEGKITIDELKELIKEKEEYSDLDYYFNNLHKVKITYNKLYKMCFTKPNAVEQTIKELLKKFDDNDIGYIAHKLLTHKFKKKYAKFRNL